MKLNNALIINYRNMCVGGIENYIASVIQVAIKERYKVFWLCDTHPIVDPIYEELLNSDNIERVPCDTHGLHWCRHKKMQLSSYEKVIVLSFNFMDHIRGLTLLQGCGCKKKYPWFIIPHFTGGLLYPESNFKIITKVVRSFCAQMYERFIRSDEMLFMASNHPEALEKEYSIVIPQEKRIRTPNFQERRAFDENRIRQNYRRKEFVIVSAGRLEFPHKGFVLGLLEDFVKIKEKYPFIKLLIIGDGANKDILIEKIRSLPRVVRKDIEYKGMMPFEQLLDEYEKCNLSISVAGCASAGAKIGLITLPARHYFEKCEVYGFIPQSKTKTTSTEPGEPINKYVEQIMHMSEDEYVALSKLSYDCYEDSIITMGSLCHEMTNAEKYYPTVCTKILCYILDILEKVNYKLNIL